MAYTLANSITYARSFIANLDPTLYTGSEPALTAASTIAALMTSAPLTWPWNRSTVTQILTATQQDYTVNSATFGFLEKVNVTLASPAVLVELENVYNTKPLGLTKQPGRPNSCAVQSTVPGTSFTARFSPNPDQAYTATFIFQKAPFQFTATSNDWFSNAGIPYSYMDIFNSLFVSEMCQYANDQERALQYRQRGMAALLSKSEGLTQMQKNEILGQWMADDLQTIVANLKAQQSVQARAV